MNRPLELPWRGEEVPHVLLDILRGCNVRCRACYNTEPDRVKPMAEVMEDFELALGLRRLDCVTLLGGEPLLHPDLLPIIRTIGDRGVKVALFTNGLGLDEAVAQDLAEAGARLVVMHIEAEQDRPDLPDPAPETLRRLRLEKLALLEAAGIEGGLSVTAMEGCEEESREALDTALHSPGLAFLLLTLHLDAPAWPSLQGDIFHGLRALGPVTPAPSRIERLAALRDVLESRLGPPFTLHPSIDGDPRWFAYLVATVHREGREPEVHPLRPTWIEAALTSLLRRLRGRHFFYQPRRKRLQYLHLLLNGLAGGGLLRNLGILARVLFSGAELRVKRILLQVPASLEADGRVVYCRDCPDAVVRHGTLVPVCIGDRVLRPTPEAEDPRSCH